MPIITVTKEERDRALAGTSEGFDAERWCLDLFVRRYAFVLSAVEEILALVRDKRPLCKGTASVATRCCGFTCWFGASHGLVVDALLLQEDLRWNRKSRWLETHVLIGAEAFVDPFQGKAKAVGTVRRRGRGRRCRGWLFSWRLL